MKNYFYIAVTFVYAFVLSINIASGQIEVKNQGRVYIGGIPSPTPQSQLFINGSATTSGLEIRHGNFLAWTYAVNSEVFAPDNTSYNLKYNGSSNFYVHASGWLYAGGVFLGSDSSLKQNVRKIENPLEKLNKIGGYTYKYKPVKVEKGRDSGSTYLPDTLLHNGILAQEIEQILPDAVRTVANGKKAVDYIQLIPLLIESVKELDSEKKKQDEELALLKARFNKLGESIDTTGGNFKLKSQLPSSAYLLYQNSPNPFNTETQIKYDLKSSYTSANIYVFDLQGTLKKSYKLSGSTGGITIKSSELNAGMYLYSLIVDNVEIDTKRMLLTN